MMPARRQKGFTLIEVLLAVGLMATIMALAYGGLRASTRAALRGEERIANVQNMRMVHQFIRRQLNQVLPLAYVSDAEDRITFEGDSDSITFVGSMPGYLGFGGPQIQSLSFEPGDQGFDLVMRHMPLAASDDGGLGNTEAIVLLESVENGQFSFLGRDELGELGEWESYWETVETPPESITLEIELNESLQLTWPVLTATRQVDFNAGQIRAANYEDAIRTLMNRRRSNRR
jgi:general secretion pathway protein J